MKRFTLVGLALMGCFVASGCEMDSEPEDDVNAEELGETQDALCWISTTTPPAAAPTSTLAWIGSSDGSNFYQVSSPSSYGTGSCDTHDLRVTGIQGGTHDADEIEVKPDSFPTTSNDCINTHVYANIWAKVNGTWALRETIDENGYWGGKFSQCTFPEVLVPSTWTDIHVAGQAWHGPAGHNNEDVRIVVRDTPGAP